MVRMVSDTKVEEWLDARGLSVDPRTLVPRRSEVTLSLDIPAESGRRTNLARLLADLFRSQSEGLLWITEFGIWPSSEHRPIFAALRHAAGVDLPLEDSPGHFFSSDDSDLVVSLIAVALYFSWGAILVRGDLGLIASVSHDDWIDITGTPESLRQVRQALLRHRYLGEDEVGAD